MPTSFNQRVPYYFIVTALMFCCLYARPAFAQWSSAQLSIARHQVSAARVGTKVLFAGGKFAIPPADDASDVIDIYNDSNGSWTTAKLSEARFNMAVAVVGAKVFFAGGDNGTDLSDVVDIYDDHTGKWSTAKLSVPRAELTGVSSGTKVFFAGGQQLGRMSDVVDIYDVTTGKWSVEKLSTRRDRLVSAAVGEKVMFAGGLGDREQVYNVVDIYDTSTGAWSKTKLSSEREDLTAVSVGNKILIAGGQNSKGDSNVVDVYDNSTQTWSVTHLSIARFDLTSAALNGKAFFAGGHLGSTKETRTSNVIDIYDSNSGVWTQTELSQPRNSIATAALGTKIFFAGGWIDDVKGSTKEIDIYNLAYVHDTTPPEIKLIYPNDGVIESDNNVTLIIEVEDETPITRVMINGKDVLRSHTDLKYRGEFKFSPGENIVITAVSGGGTLVQKELISAKSPETKSNQKGKYHALLIANEKYTSFEELTAPVSDILKIEEVLTDEYQFDKRNITVLKNATFVQMHEALDALRTTISSNDLLLIFYAGHGQLDRVANIGYWLPVDADNNNYAKWIRNSTLVEDVSSIPSMHTLVIADACFAGSILKMRSVINNANPNYANMMRRNSRKAMTSGAETPVPDQSDFTRYFIKVLKENPNRFISSDELYHNILTSMKNNSTLTPMYGDLKSVGDEGGTFVFERRANN